MNVEIIKCLEDNYSYLIIDSKKNACVVDPSEEGPVIASVESNQANLKYILNTHHHFDHIGGNLNLKKKYNAKVIGYAKKLEDAYKREENAESSEEEERAIDDVQKYKAEFQKQSMFYKDSTAAQARKDARK